jgi:SAM-dependent methyltransferase
MTATPPDRQGRPAPAPSQRDPIKEFYARRETLWGPANPERLERFLAAYRNHRALLGRRLSILDLGCGREPYFAAHTVDGDEYWAADIAPPHVEVPHFVPIDLNSLEGAAALEGKSFDVIFCGELIEHLFSPDLLLEWMKTLMHKESLLIISTPNLAYWVNRLLLMLGITPLFLENSSRKRLGRRFQFLGQGGAVEGHIRVFTHRAMLELLAEHQFSVKDVIPVSVWNLPFDRLACRSPYFAPDNIYLVRHPG